MVGTKIVGIRVTATGLVRSHWESIICFGFYSGGKKCFYNGALHCPLQAVLVLLKLKHILTTQCLSDLWVSVSVDPAIFSRPGSCLCSDLIGVTFNVQKHNKIMIRTFTTNPGETPCLNFNYPNWAISCYCSFSRTNYAWIRLDNAVIMHELHSICSTSPVESVVWIANMLTVMNTFPSLSFSKM